MKIMVMGVSGSGKSSVGAALALSLGLPFLDADDLHPPENRAKMAAGQPLTDEDRWPWLTAVAAAVEAAGPCVLACSALKRRYRDHLRQRITGPFRIVHLTGPREVIARRLAARKGHFMPPTLLQSQLEALEPPGPDEALTADLTLPLADLVAEISRNLAAPI